MQTISLNRYLQQSYQCAIAASASLANYYNENIDYSIAQSITKNHVNKDIDNGLYSAEIGLLLNYLGFYKVSIITSDLNYLSYDWRDLSPSEMCKAMQSHTLESDEYAHVINTSVKFLNNSRYNKIIIDYNFKDHIMHYIDSGVPVMLSFNWNMYFKRGGMADWQEHAVCCNGYNSHGVNIVDSNNESSSGEYVMQWEHLLSCMHFGDIVVGEKYKKNFQLTI